MSLTISYVRRLEDIVEPARAFLSRDYDLFAKPRIVVPTAGAKAWLWSQLAQTLGASRGGPDGDGESLRDGIVANVEISYPGTILALLQPQRGRASDPWSFDRLTFTVLDMITGPEAAGLGIPFDVSREPLLAARRIAGLFDEYHVRRPGMILAWDNDKPSRSLQPTANDEQQGGEPLADLISDQDRWQFDLWRLVRQRISKASPPLRASVDNRAPHPPLLVAGLQSLSWPQLHALEQLGTACDVEVLLVHPSPGLRDVWQAIEQPPLEPKLRGRPLRRNSRKSEAEAAEADVPTLPEGIDPLPGTWLSGARELQQLISSQGVTIAPLPVAAARPRDNLLQRLQETVVSGREPGDDQPRYDPARDHSIAIHRCHSMSRQAEVLHEAILHAFTDPKLAGLQPHDVVIMSPCLEQAAPHLEAVFQRTIVGHDAAKATAAIKLPLVVADRGLRKTSEAVDLLSQVLALPGSRCSVDDVLAIAGHPLVRPHLGIDDDTVAMWQSLLERTQVRWGLDHIHRERGGLSIGDERLRDVHTWKSGLEQMLLGATLPDDVSRPELGGVVPLADLDPADLQAITKLIGVLDCLSQLATIATRPATVAAWCDAIETAVVSLCGERCPEVGEPLGLLRRLREAAAGAAADHKLGFDEVRTLLAEWSEEKAGRQPLHTGAITATSMVPLRGVPFRVVCVMGYDDEAIGTPEPSKDDLVAKTPLVGDVDPRAEQRRALLDCLMAAQDRLVITCTGRDVKTNEDVPLVTPLAEFVEFAVRHGVGRDKPTGPSQIEIDHPRHHLGRRNFVAGAVQPGVTWSHDAIAAKAAAAVGRRTAESEIPRRAAPAQASAAPAEKPEIEISLLENFVKDPLGLYLEHNFEISTWRDDDEATPATLPLALEDKDARTLTLDLLGVITADPRGQAAWQDAMVRSGRLPLGPHGEKQLEEISLLAAGLRDGLIAHGLAYGKRQPQPLGSIDIDHFRLVGHLDDVDTASRQLVFVFPKEIKTASYGRPLHMAAVKLLAARAAGIDVTHATIVSRRTGWKPGKKSPTRKEPDRLMEPFQTRVVRLAENLMQSETARKRLCEIAALLKQALADLRPAFGEVITCDPPGRIDRFEAHVGEWWYRKTSEFVVFGASPVFDDVYGAHPDRIAFLDDFGRTMEPGHVNNNEGYRLS